MLWYSLQCPACSCFRVLHFLCLTLKMFLSQILAWFPPLPFAGAVAHFTFSAKPSLITLFLMYMCTHAHTHDAHPVSFPPSTTI